MTRALVILLLAAAPNARAAEPVADGIKIRYLYGLAPAKVVCAPFRLCLVELQPGERIVRDGLHLGDTYRWEVSVATGGAQQVVVLKPAVPGLQTTASILTDRRTYYLDLESHETDYMPTVAWLYPETPSIDGPAPSPGASRGVTALARSGEDISTLDFGYSVAGCDCSFKPARVYHNGQQTVIDFAPSAFRSELPALLVIGADGEESLVNYRRRGNSYVVDAVIDEAVLIVGVGRKQRRVTIAREGS